MWKKCRIINKSPHLLFETSEYISMYCVPWIGNVNVFNFQTLHKVSGSKNIKLDTRVK